MTLTSTKSWKHYMLICRTLEYNDIHHVRDDKSLCVRCRISGKDFEQHLLFQVDPTKMLVSLYCALPLAFVKEQTADLALAVCMANNGLPDGSFCIDPQDRLLYFKMTNSFYETNLNGMLFEYMLSSAADLIDEYYPKFRTITG